MKLRHILFTMALAITCSSKVFAADDVLRVATDATFPPFEYVENGKRTGFDVEMIEALGKVMGKKIEWIDIDFKGLIPAVLSKRADVAASAIYITDERLKVVNFTHPYYTGGLAILVKADNTAIKEPADLNGKKVSVQVGTKSVQFLKESYPKVERVEVEKNDQMFELVKIGRADAAVTGKPAALLYAKANPVVKVLDKTLTVERYGFAVRKGDTELTNEMNKALEKLRADGTYAALVAKYFGTAK